MTNRRVHDRYVYRDYASITTGELSISCHIINISKKGALVAVLSDHDFKVDDTLTLHIEIEGDIVKLKSRITHTKDHFIGLECATTDELSEEKLNRFIDGLHQLSG